MRNYVHITSFTIGGIDSPLVGRVPNAGNCRLVRRSIMIIVTCIIAVIELILQSISPVCLSIDAPAKENRKRMKNAATSAAELPRDTIFNRRVANALKSANRRNLIFVYNAAPRTENGVTIFITATKFRHYQYTFATYNMYID